MRGTIENLSLRSAGRILIIYLCASLAAGQSVPDLRFNGHSLGEAAETFFSTATMMDSKKPTTEHCHSVLNDVETVRRYEASRNGANKKDFLLSDVGGCQNVMAALRGERAPIGARFASELGKGGHVVFANGKLVSFTLSTDSAYADVASDMKRRFGEAGRKYTAAQISDGTRWELAGVEAIVFKTKYQSGVGIYVGFAVAQN